MNRTTLNKVRALVAADRSMSARERSYWRAVTSAPTAWDFPRVLKTREVADILGVHICSVGRYAKQGYLVPVGPKHACIGYTEASLREFMEGAR